MKSRITTGGYLGGYVPQPLSEAVDKWIEQDPERNHSMFLRQAAREKLKRDGIEVVENIPAPTV